MSTVALVSGGSRGIGRAVALRLAADGAAVAVTYASDSDAAEETVRQIRAEGGTGLALRLSAERWADVGEVVDRVVSDLGPVGILVNNAGVPSAGTSVVDTDPADAERVILVNTMSAYYLSRAVIPSMRASGSGSIVMVSSRSTVEIGANRAPYAMSKAALEMLAATLAIEERPAGIRVNTIAPGFVETELGRLAVLRRHGLSDLDELAAQAPFGRFCTPEDVAATVAFLVSDAGSYITGQRIGVDGGGTNAVFASAATNAASNAATNAGTRAITRTTSA